MISKRVVLMGIMIAVCAILGTRNESSARQITNLSSWKTLFDLRPSVSDISATGHGRHKLYSGPWWRNDRLPITKFADTVEGLAIPLGGEITTTTIDARAGALPLINGSQSFYVEFDVKLSSNDRDHWPAVWLMPIEHDVRKTDMHENGIKENEHWVEIDVDEGGFGLGTHGVLHEWSGIWPKFESANFGPKTSNNFIDRTKFNRFGFSYHAETKIAYWWLNGTRGSAYAIPWMPNHHYYLIITAASHGEKKNYQLIIRNLRALIPR